MGLWNIHGINSWKLEHSDFISFIYNHSIVFLTETWKRSDNTNLLYNNDDFIEFHVCRQVVKTAKRNSGGITVLIRKEIEMYIEHVKSYGEGIIWFKLPKEHTGTQYDIYLCCTYIPPINSPRHLLSDENMFDVLYGDILKYNDLGYCIIYGDFNSRCGDLSDFIDSFNDTEDIDCMNYNTDVKLIDITVPRSSEDGVINVYGRKLIDFCIAHDLYIVNGRTASDPEGSNTCYTHNGSSLVDYVLCSRYVVDCIDLKVEDLNPLSDHCSITTSISLKTGIIHKQDISTDIEPTCNTRKHVPYKWKHDFRQQYETNIESIVVKTQLHNLYDILNKERITPYTLNNSVLTLTAIIRDASKECASNPKPTRHNKKLHMPWYDIECKTHKHRFSQAKHKLKIHKNSHTLLAVHNARTSYNKCCKAKKAKHDKHLTESLMKLKYENPRLFWRAIKPHRSFNCPITLDSFHTYFSRICNKTHNLHSNAKTDSHIQRYMHAPIVEQLDQDFTISEVAQTISCLRHNKSPGHDNILNECLLHCNYSILCIITRLFNHLFNLGIFPEYWSHGMIVPIYKKGDPILPNNYRPITLLSSIGKLFTCLL